MMLKRNLYVNRNPVCSLVKCIYVYRGNQATCFILIQRLETTEVGREDAGKTDGEQRTIIHWFIPSIMLITIQFFTSVSWQSVDSLILRVHTFSFAHCGLKMRLHSLRFHWTPARVTVRGNKVRLYPSTTSALLYRNINMNCWTKA